MPAEPERLTYVSTIDCDHLGERTANAAYILTLKVSYDCRPAPQHVMSWHLGQIGRGAVQRCRWPARLRRLHMVRLTTPTKSQHQPKTLRAGLDGRDRSRASGCFMEFFCARKG